MGVVHQGFEAISGARAYVAGEGHWSKAQKDAVYHLLRYVLLEEEDGYDRFLAELDVPLGDRDARLALDQSDPDVAVARDGFLRGRNHPDDIDRMVTFFLRWRNLSYVDRAIQVWAEGDAQIEALLALGEELRTAREAGVPGEDLVPLLDSLDALNASLTELEARFSAELGAGARWAQATMLLVVVAAAVILFLLIAGLVWVLRRRFAHSEAARRASDARHRDLFQQSPFGVYRSAPDGRIVEANPALARILGYPSAASLRGLDLSEGVYVDPSDRDRILAEIEARGGVLRGAEVEWRRSDGTPVRLSLTGRALTAARGEENGFEIFVEDVTERRALEAQLRESQKMEALGQLTGGIAHDFNNLLTVILSSATFLEEELDALQAPDTPAAREDLENLRRAATRGAEMVRKLLAFSRRAVLTVSEVHLPDLVRETQGILGRLLPSSIEVRLEVEEEVPPVLADAGAIEQILLNLATNARDAMPKGGRLTLSVRHEVDAGDGPGHVVLGVADSGEGMSGDVQERAFEPFYTTKPMGAGTGLGLPMVYGLAQQHEAWVELRSRPGEGTEIEVGFPIRAAEPG